MDIRIEEDGTLTSIYEDGVEAFVADIGGSMSVSRLSHVEWEAGGWTVRAAHDTSLAIREDGSVSREGPLAVFRQREAALAAEKQNVWRLLP